MNDFNKYVNGVKQKINSIAGNLGNRNEAKSTVKPNGPSVGSNDLSASKSDSKDILSQTLQDADLFFRFSKLDIADLNKKYGYSLVIKDVVSDSIKAKFNFPINPQNISISVPSAMSLEATMKGIYSTDNGAPFRSISISGTTGTNPLTLNKAKNDEATAVQRNIEYAFKNTIKAFSSTINQFNRTINAFSSPTQSTTGKLNYTIKEISDHLPGYQTIHDLIRFLDYYLAGKKLAQNKGWRLYFLMHKDQAYYTCGLNNYSWNKQAGTLEYQYSIQLTAYKRDAKDPTNSARVAEPKFAGTKASSSQLSNIINGIDQARRSVASVHGILSGIRSDILESFIRPVGEIALLGKEIVGANKSIYDFAFSGETTKAMEESFKQYFTDNKSDMQNIAAGILGLGLVGAIGATGKPESAMNTTSQQKLSSGKAEQFQNSEDSADPIKALFANPANFPDVFTEFPIDDMNLSTEINDQLNSITDSISLFTADDLIERKKKIADFSRSISEAFGGGSASYNAVKGLNAPKKTYKKLSVEDITLLNELNKIVINIDKMISMFDTSESSEKEDYYQFYSDYAVSQGLLFNQSNLSRFFVPFPVGATLEQLAGQYLGSPDRWIEIAALNSLKAPYIDEVGFEIKITASAGGDTLTVADAENLYIGQVVEVVSDVVGASKRKIRSIDIVNAIETIVTFESVANKPLTAYKPSQNARIVAFMPNTVNSNMLIAIPSAAAPTFNTTFKTSPEVDELNGIARIAKVDFLLDSNGDIIITGGGDVRLAYGLTNLIQAAVLKIKTKTDELLHLPAYGNPVDAGISTADIDAKTVLQALSSSFDNDPRFSGILAGEVQKLGPTVNVSILVGVQNTEVTLPISSEIPR
jgi:hypothetical protein